MMQHEETGFQSAQEMREAAIRWLRVKTRELERAPEPSGRRPVALTIQEQAQALYDKLTCCQFCRQRPSDAPGFIEIIASAIRRQAPIDCIVGHGPLKNPNNVQRPTADWAEFFAYAQLMRLQRAITTLYAPGLNVSLILDDARAEYANGVSPTLTQIYRESVVRLISQAPFHGLISQAIAIRTLYEAFDHARYVEQAALGVDAWMACADNALALAAYEAHARTNLPAWRLEDCEDPEQEIRAAVRRYLVYYEAEKLSGMWRRPDALVLRFSPHAGACQLFTLRKGSVSQPWQGEGAITPLGAERFDPVLLTRAKRRQLRRVAEASDNHWTPLLGPLPLMAPAPANPTRGVCNDSSRERQSATATRFY